MSKKLMVLSPEKTVEIANAFFQDTLNFWKLEKLNRSDRYEFEIDPVKMAIKETKSLTNNPYSPNGEMLDRIALVEWVEGEY